MKQYILRCLLIITYHLLANVSTLTAQNAKTDSLFHVLKTAKEDSSKVKTLNALSNEFRSNDPDTAIHFGYKAMKLATELNYKLGIANAYLFIGGAKKNLAAYDEALKLNFKAIKIFEELKYSRGIINAYKIIGNIYKKIGKYQEALETHEACLKLALAADDKMGISASYNNIGNIFEEQGNYAEALMNHEASLKIQEAVGDKKGVASSLMNIGNIYIRKGNYPESMNKYLLALKIQDEIGDKRTIANTHSNIGNVYLYQKNCNEAMKRYMKALKLQKEIGDKEGEASTYNSIGNVYYEEANYAQALWNQHRALEINKEIGNLNLQANVYENIGVIYTEQGKYNAALDNFNEALKIGIKTNDKNGHIVALLNIGNVYNLQKKSKEASGCFNNALLISKEIGSLFHTMDSYRLISETDSIQGDYKNAFENYKKRIAFRDSLFNEENTKKLVQSQMQYEFDKKETATKAEQDKKDALAIAELGKQKVIRNAIAGGTGILLFSSLFSFMFYKRRRDAVEKQKEAEFGMQVSDVEMKALRSQMNPHFIFNSLNSIHRFIQQQNAKDASAYIIKFSRLMRLVLENSEYQQVELKKDLEALNLYMQLESLRMDKHFEFEIKVDDSIDEENTLVPPLILQPFIENSIWHGLMLKETTGKITIHISKENEMIKCIVEDNGIGREKAQALKIENKEKKSLGMKITKARIDIINKIKKSNAGIELIDLAEGMRVVVRLPLELSF